MYLPRSAPPNQPRFGLVHDPLLGYEAEEDEFSTADLCSSSSAHAALEKLQMSAEVFITLPNLC